MSEIAPASQADIANFRSEHSDALMNAAHPLHAQRLASFPPAHRLLPRLMRKSGRCRSLLSCCNGLTGHGGFSFATTATTQDIAGVFGGTWKTAHRIFSSDDATFVGSRATAAIMRMAVGSGTNGPSRADYSLHIETQKTDWLTSAVLGEVDGLMLTIRQSSEGDSGGILINHSKVESASYGAVGIEQTLAWVQATTGTKLRSIHSTMGSHLPSTDIRRDGVGFATRADVGSARTGYLVYDNGGSWLYAFVAASSMAAGTDYFHVTGPDNPDGVGLVRIGNGSVTAPSLAIKGNPGTGLFWNGLGVLGVSAGGASVANFGPGGVRIGTGLVDQGAGTLNVGGAYYVDGTFVIDPSRGHRLRSYTASQLATATDPVNTTDKAAGKCVWDATNNRIVTAGGSSATSNWYVDNGTVAITPA